MLINEWDDENFDTLIYSICQKDCILMLGPDVETELVNEQPRALTELLAEQLASKLEESVKNQINSSDLAQVAQYYCADKGRLDLEKKVSDFYKERKTLTNTFHENLAALDFYLIITTTPASMLYEALQQNKKMPLTDYYNFKGAKPQNVIQGTVETPLLYNLYGSVENPKSLLLTENDLLDFLVALISKKAPLPDNILSEFRNESKSFLFLGFGFRHWYLRILLHALLQGDHKKGSHSFALEQLTAGSTPDIERNAFYFMKSDYQIHIFKGNLCDFVTRLREKYDLECKQGSIETNPNAPEVFICHTNEDSEDAISLYSILKEAGIKPWIDKENLRGGDKWDSKIQDTINKVNYFVVLNSKTLEKKRIAYVNREIDVALDRQKDFRGIPFIIPVKIDDNPIIKEFSAIQAIDLTDKNNMKELITLIRRDFALWRK